MTDAAADLIALLELERLETNLFRGRGDGGETPTRVFGGLVIAQALVAAYRTVEDRACHSLHAYFIRPGDPSIPIVYEVDRARDGGSFTTRRVVAIQHGRQIFNLAASFHVEEPGWTHQHDAPPTPEPETLPSRAELRARDAERVSPKWREDFLRPRPVEIREVDPLDLLDPSPMPDANRLWFRVPGVGAATPELHQCLLAYASDMNLLGSGARPHGVSFMSGTAMFASLDHAMWFHAPLRFDDWHLYAMDSPFTGGARAFNRGLIYDRAGRLVASTAQEGLMRPIDGTRKG
ncbi:MAG TPA: acyl-CoA thioesterase II [Paracoccaceae bacterium]|nr:acyl-CoA thioesterase II [Paracoccaceae bacterium]